jgi:8-oxo-dGTP diphosphatase
LNVKLAFPGEPWALALGLVQYPPADAGGSPQRLEILTRGDMMQYDQPLEFGDRVAGQHYQPRPGSYAVIVGRNDQVALVRTSDGCFLPGGGAEPAESPEETLKREVLEECGAGVEIVRPLGFAIEYVVAEGKRYFAKQCTFFEARLGEQQAPAVEPDHELIWLPIPEALGKLTHRSQAWAVRASSL